MEAWRGIIFSRIILLVEQRIRKRIANLIRGLPLGCVSSPNSQRVVNHFIDQLLGLSAVSVSSLCH